MAAIKPGDTVIIDPNRQFDSMSLRRIGRLAAKGARGVVAEFKIGLYTMVGFTETGVIPVPTDMLVLVKPSREPLTLVPIEPGEVLDSQLDADQIYILHNSGALLLVEGLRRMDNSGVCYYRGGSAAVPDNGTLYRLVVKS